MAEKEIHKSYYAIIPANVRYDKDLTPNAKLLYGEITALCNEKGHCWATNDYFSNLYGVSKTSISKWINSLVKKGYISSEIVYVEGTKQIKDRYLTIIQHPIKEKLNTPIEENDSTIKPINNIILLKENNTIVNITDEYLTTTYKAEDLILKSQFVESKAILFISNAQIQSLKEQLTKEELDYYLMKMVKMLADDYQFSCSHYEFIMNMVKKDRGLKEIKK